MNYMNPSAEAISIKNIPASFLKKYFERIGYSGTAVADLETLQTIHRLHTSSIPFENLNPLLHWPVKLDIESLQEKIINNRRGGYCFEHNILLGEALRQIGFEVRWLGGRVLWNRPEGTVNARTHMLLQVSINGEKFIADAGFGGLTLTGALRLQAEIEQTTPHEPFRLILQGEEYTLEAKVKEEWQPLYFFSLQEQVIKDYEVMSWYLCNHPESHFIKTLRAAISGPGVRYALNNNEFAIHRLNSGTERKTLATSDELMNVLQNIFLIQLPDTPELRTVIEQVMQNADA
jgi:N-hydroxyarylamine O-acetyltransferase